MRQPPPITAVPRYPVVAITAALAVAASAAYWMKRDVSFLFEDAHIAEGQLWRLATSMFPHGDVVHLAFNLYWLWIFGTAVEEAFGRFKTAALFLLFAVGSGAAEYAILDGGIGLSGVVYGLFGLLWVLSLYDGRFHDAVDTSVVKLFVFWFFLCIVMTVAKLMNVGNIAHGAGAILGVLVGYAIVAKPRLRAISFTGAITLLLVSLAGATILREHTNLSPYRGYEESELGYQALLAEDNQKAERWLVRATRLKPDESSYWYNLGLAQHRLDKFEPALESFRRAHELDPGDEEAESTLKSFEAWLDRTRPDTQPVATE